MSMLPPDTFPPDIEAYVQQKIAEGRFKSREELTLAADRVYRDMEQRHEQLKADIQAAIAEADAGKSAPLDIAALKAELMDELDENGHRKGSRDLPPLWNRGN